MPLKKLSELPDHETCRHPEHDPPMHIVLRPGIYEYTCPACGRSITFRVQPASLLRLPNAHAHVPYRPGRSTHSMLSLRTHHQLKGRL